MSDEKKSNWLARAGLFFIKSPVNMIFALALAYFASKAYLFSGGLTDKLIMFGIIGLWMFWFIAKHILILALTLVLLGGGAYWYYSYTHQAENECRENGGEWNKKTKTCEEKSGWLAKVQKLWAEYLASDSKERSK